MTTKASIPADASTRPGYDCQLLVELHLLLSGLVLLLGFLFGLQHVLFGLLLGELGLLVVVLLLALLLFFLLLEEGIGVAVIGVGGIVQRLHVAGLRGQPDLGAVAAGLRPRTRTQSVRRRR